MNYYEKYLKYKQKYLELKGAGVNDSKPKDQFSNIRNNKNLSNEFFRIQFYNILAGRKYQSLEPKFNARELKQRGFTADDLIKLGFDNYDLKTTGYNASELKFLGAKILLELGFTIQQLKEAGYLALELKTTGVTVQQLKDAGFTVNELYKADVKFTDMKQAGYTVSDFKSNEMMTPTLIKSLGFNKKEALDGGYTEDELKMDY